LLYFTCKNEQDELFYNCKNELNLPHRKRAANKRRKMKTLGKSRSTETDDEDEENEEGKPIQLNFYNL